MHRLTVQAATYLSAQSICSALSEFDPELIVEDDDQFFILVDLGSNRHVVEAVNALHGFLGARADGTAVTSMFVALDDGVDTLHATPL
jgi:hypothetical protein